MNEISPYLTELWNALNYPLLKLGKTTFTLWGILFNSLLVLLFVLISTRIRHWLLWTINRRSGINISNWRAAITIGYYAFLIIGLLSIIQTTGIDLSFFTVLTGAIGIGIGFGMQMIFSNLLSGIIILSEKPLKLGDRIEIGNVSGNVQSISVRATTIVTNDNVSIIVPNSDFISKQVINWSLTGNNVRTSISVNVAYDSDPDLVARLLLEVADQEPGVLKSPPPAMRLVEFGENGLSFSLLVWTREYADRKGALKSLLNLRVLKAFRENGVHIPYPQREIRMIADQLKRTVDP